mmetsp:Transcript_10281/g.27898  ORF Transcript_10281/g.27898 Transcript_10281/m.27898 type:complete len:336 (-) Transcript_10281:801-1808(-)
MHRRDGVESSGLLAAVARLLQELPAASGNLERLLEVLARHLYVDHGTEGKALQPCLAGLLEQLLRLHGRVERVVGGSAQARYQEQDRALPADVLAVREGVQCIVGGLRSLLKLLRHAEDIGPHVMGSPQLSLHAAHALEGRDRLPHGLHRGSEALLLHLDLAHCELEPHIPLLVLKLLGDLQAFFHLAERGLRVLVMQVGVREQVVHDDLLPLVSTVLAPREALRGHVQRRRVLLHGLVRLHERADHGHLRPGVAANLPVESNRLLGWRDGLLRTVPLEVHGRNGQQRLGLLPLVAQLLVERQGLLRRLYRFRIGCVGVRRHARLGDRVQRPGLP